QAADKLFQFAEEELSDPQWQGLRKRLLESVLADYQTFIELRRDDPRAQAVLAEVRDRVQTIVNDLAVLQGAGQSLLLRESAVLDDLKATPEQRQKLEASARRLDLPRNEMFRDFRPQNTEEQRQKLLKMVRAEDKLIAEIFSEDQIHRLKQIALQSKGSGAFHDLDIA